MSYQVLARKWRPKKFSELVGQSHVVTAITNGLDNDRLHHAYLFTGTRGVGKTTIARIFAKSLNCESGQSANPCGKCGTCLEVDKGSFVDLIEIDAASKTKVEDTRELLDNVQYRPTHGQYKVYLIDEVHMLSKHSFNALLKTLEEPPPHVKFLLATTDPQKLPITILSRCLQFNLKALSREEIQSQLTHVLTQEQISFEPAALTQLARAANGSMRDALSLTDQAIAQGNNQVVASVVTDMLGLMDKNQILRLLHALLTKDQALLMEQVDALAGQGVDFGTVLDELLALIHQVALTQVVPDVCKLDALSAKGIYSLAKSVSPEHIQLLYSIAVQGKKDMPYLADGRMGLEMTLLRMLSFTPVTDTGDFAAVIEEQMQSHLVAVDEKVVFDAQVNMITPAQSTVCVATESVAEDSLDVDSGMNDMFAQQDEIIERATAQHPEQFSSHSSNEPIATETSTVVPPQQVSTDTHVPSNDSDVPAHMQEHPPIDAAYFPTHADDHDEQHMAERRTQSMGEIDDTNYESTVANTETTPAITASLDDLFTAQDKIKARIDAEKHTSANTISQATTEPQNDVLATPDNGENGAKDVTFTPSAEGQLSTSNPSVEIVNAEDTQTQQPLVQPETDPSKMGLDHGPAQSKHVTLHDVDVTNLSANLPNGEKLESAAQVDYWSNVISQLNINGLVKQLAIQAMFSQNGSAVTLTIGPDSLHLVNDSTIQSLQDSLAQHFAMTIEVTVEQGLPEQTPLLIQRRINAIRTAHAQTLFANDPNMQALTATFGANVKPNSLQLKK